MTAIPRRYSPILLFAAAALSAGCQASTMAYFLFPEAKHEAEMKKLASEDKKEVRVVILTYTPQLETRPEFIQADRSMAEMLAKTLRDSCEANGENVTIVNPHKVEQFKSEHPNWQQEPNLAEIGRQFKADYVVYIEISSLSMYEKGCANLYHGQANLSVQLIDVHKPGEGPLPQQVSYVYPDAKGPIPVEDMQPMEFRQKFLGYITTRLGRFFTATPIQDTYYVEQARFRGAGGKSMSESLVIRCRENGPYVVQGAVKIVDHLGNEFVAPPGGKAGVALCRCGASRTKPFCDGSHRDCGFQAAGTATSTD